MNNISNKTKETLINSLRNSDLKIIKKKVTTQPVQRVHKQIFATDYADVTD